MDYHVWKHITTLLVAQVTPKKLTKIKTKTMYQLDIIIEGTLWSLNRTVCEIRVSECKDSLCGSHICKHPGQRN